MFSFENNAVIAVAVSGGPDSMALLHLLSRITRVAAVTVEHGLRAESLDEAEAVSAWCKQHKIEHHILSWRGAKPKTGVHEAARSARYQLLEEFCRARGILHLATAHHADDQAETILQRVAKASGPAGLAGIAEHNFTPHLHLWRPLLSHLKQDLVDYCAHFKLPYVRDASNEKYARGRLRGAADVLAAEGLTSANLTLLAQKQKDANAVLDLHVAHFLAARARLFHGERAEVDLVAFARQPVAIQQMALDKILKFVSSQDAPIRYDSIANLSAEITSPGFRPKTLGHCYIKIKKLHGQSMLIITPEAA